MKTNNKFYNLTPLFIIICFLNISCLGQQRNLAKRGAREALTKANLFAFVIGLERYATDRDGDYPDSLNELKDTDFLDEWPENAWTTEPMRQIEFGEENFTGECMYLPFPIENGEDYYILVFGSEDSEGMDIDDDGEDDHVILLLADGIEELHPEYLDRKDLPLIKDLLGIQD